MSRPMAGKRRWLIQASWTELVAWENSARFVGEVGDKRGPHVSGLPLR